MTLNAQVIRQNNENNSSLLRRFSRRVQGARVIPEVRRHRYYERPLSKQMKKKRKLEQIRRAERLKWLSKLGEL